MVVVMIWSLYFNWDLNQVTFITSGHDKITMWLVSVHIGKRKRINALLLNVNVILRNNKSKERAVDYATRKRKLVMVLNWEFIPCQMYFIKKAITKGIN